MASSSNTESQAIYDIFLSFRGPDTRTKFTDRLYETLKEKGYNPFRDREGIGTGENIKFESRKAIENSKISIIVFSNNYTTSMDCLFEIQTIIKHREKNPDYIIVPVYYEVDPFKIKTQAQDWDKMTGVEVEVEGKKVMVADFEGKEVTVEMLKEWSAALMKVARLGGLVSGDGYEADLIADIVAVLGNKQARNYIDLDEKLRTLKRKVVYLISQESDINSEITNAERPPWKRRKKEVEVWLTDVQSLKEYVQRLEQEVVGEMNVSSCMQLGKDIVRKTQEASELQEKGKGFGGLLIDENPTGRLPVSTPKDFVESTKARKTENIWECLMSDKVMKIGVYGMGGIGKTTIMKHIHNKLLAKKDNLVYWVTVSKNSDIAKLQSDIANAVNLDLGEDEDVTRRALRLHSALSKQRRYVLILDDVWEPFDLEMVGIPEPTRSNGCKLVLTTRWLEEVCHKMSWEPIKVHLLTEEESWNLFLTKAVEHDTVLAPNVEKIARQISEECACLPLTIITVAGSLRGLTEMREWRHALKELTSITGDACDVTKVLERLQFSYNRLGETVLRECFLYCSLYPEDKKIGVAELIDHWIAEGLISENNSVEVQVDEGHAILMKLTRRCLLESSIDKCKECVTMNHLIRDMALRIAQSSHPRFLVRTDKSLESIPFEDWSEDLERVSFMQSSIQELPDRSPVCPRLTTLLWSGVHWFPEISDNFFTNMPGLKVLDFSDSRMKSLPESISNLENLQAIILQNCQELEYVPSLKRLKALKRFSLTWSKVEELPEGIEELVNLRKLDLGYNKRLGEMPAWKLSRLSKLQDLTIHKTRLGGVSAEQVLCLRQLRVLDAQFQNVQQLSKYLTSQEFQGLEKYNFELGNCFPSTRIEKNVALNFDGLGSEVDDLVLPADLGGLTLCEFVGPGSLSAIPCIKDAKGLRICRVEWCTGLESVFSSSIFSEDGQIVLRTIETLELSDLPRFRVLFDKILPPHNISYNLERLSIEFCDSVKNIFPFQLLHNFPNLNFLGVGFCSDLEDIIVEKEEISDCDHHQDNRITLPKLKTLYVQYLPRLRSIYDGTMVCPSLEVVGIIDCPRLRRLPFSPHMVSEQVTAVPALRAITGAYEWWESLEWDDPLTKTSLQPYWSEAEFIEEIVAVHGTKQAGNKKDLDEKLQTLKRKVEYLISQKIDINTEITNAERRPWKRRKKEVEVWRTDVQSLKEYVQRLEQEVVGEMNVFSCIQLGKDIVKKTREAFELQEKGKGFDENPTGRLPVSTSKDFVEFTKARNNIWEPLMSDEVMKIGVYGMGGIGKTTIMKHIHNKLLAKKENLVYWVTVSKNSDIAKLQSDIANAVNLDLGEDEDVTSRASQLHSSLSKQRRYVLIFDDVWEPFDLEMVGIPEPTRSNGCKLVLTTRWLEEVCHKMGWEPIKVHLLTEEESWNLFLTKAVEHDTVLAPNVEKVARQISEKCACLPLTIITVAGSLQGLTEMHEWQHALKELTSITGDACDVTKVLERLQFSYNRLGETVLRDCFLYCSLYPEDKKIGVAELIDHWIAEGLISENNSVDVQVDEGHAILKKLTRRCLLESSIDKCKECVTMNRLIRDMALRIAQSSHPRFLVWTDKSLESIPFEDWSEDLERVSFMQSYIRELPDRHPVCPRLTTLLWSGVHWFPENSDCFFTNMPGLKVLDFSDSRMKSLPVSISNLENLQAIILQNCQELEYVPSLKRLKALKRFSLTWSKVEELPKGIEELVNLRKLDLGYNERLGEISAWKLSRLSKLQDLTIRKTRLGGVSAEQVLCLRQLRVLDAQFQNVQQLSKYLTSQEFQGLEKYTFVLGDCFTPTRHGKNVAVNFDGLGSEVDDLVLPAGLVGLTLSKFIGPTSLSAIPCIKDARDLRICRVEWCKGLESVFSSSIFSEDGPIVLSSIETLELSDLPRFRVLFDKILPPHNISYNLERLSIEFCDSVKNIFPFQLLHNFPNLNFLGVGDCPDLEEIIVKKKEISDCDHHQDNIITLPKLKTLYVQSLPGLRSIYDGMMVCPSLEVVGVRDCPRLRRLPFSLHMGSKQVTAVPALKAISGEYEWWESLEWDDPLTKTILQPYWNDDFRDLDSEMTLQLE